MQKLCTNHKLLSNNNNTEFKILKIQKFNFEFNFYYEKLEILHS